MSENVVVASSETASRGRAASPRTVAIRKLLDETDGEATYSTALPLLQGQGYEIDPASFNVTKSAWKRNRNLKHLVDEDVEVTMVEAVNYVSEMGGLAKAEADVRKRLALVKVFCELLEQAQKLAA